MLLLITEITIFTICLLAGLILVRKLKAPEKSYFYHFLTILLTPIRSFGLSIYKTGQFSVKKSMDFAVKKTKLSDWGDDSDNNFEKFYTSIMESPRHKAQRYSNIGYIFAQNELNMTWVRRLKFVQYLKDVPEVLNIPVRSPVFVMGLPRTGTTFLHRLLSLDPKSRAPLTWELLASVPKPTGSGTEKEHTDDRESRAKYIRNLIKQRNTIGDSAVDHIHGISSFIYVICI